MHKQGFVRAALLAPMPLRALAIFTFALTQIVLTCGLHVCTVNGTSLALLLPGENVTIPLKTNDPPVITYAAKTGRRLQTFIAPTGSKTQRFR